MAIYICNECGEFRDDDIDLCETDPRDDTKLICLDCAERLEDEEE